MDPEEQARFLAPTREQLASVTVFPLIPYLKEDATVSAHTLLRMSYCSRRCPDDYRYAIGGLGMARSNTGPKIVL